MPALLGKYPPELKNEIFGDAWPEWADEDYALIKQKLDFIGINYYTRSVTQATDSYPLKAGAVRQKLGTYTETGWEVFPQGLTDLLVWVEGPLRQPADLHHRERRRVLRPAGRRGRPRARSAAHGLSAEAPDARSAMPSTRAATSAATWCGRCWTTSSGRWASRSASASCT